MATKKLPRPDIQLTDFHGLLTASARMRAFFEVVTRVARTDSTVVIRGQTGTGKELIARAIHRLGGRHQGPYRAINCATLTPELLASELFGHVRGSFTGAIKDRRGLFALADGGTIFLDEIAEIPLALQARLLRILQERTFVPVGGTEPQHVDVRIVSATHRALRRAVEDRRFRADLMYRLRVVPIYLPPLRDRSGDVEALSWHFMDRFNAKGGRAIHFMTETARDALLDYPWPGNVRELRNVVEYAFAVGVGDALTLDDLTPELRGESPPEDMEPRASADDAERTRIEQALRAAGGRKAVAAQALGLSRSTLWRKMREYKLS